MENLNIEELRKAAYRIAWEQRDYKIIDKIISGIEDEIINKESFYSVIKKFTKSIKSDHMINRWQVLSDWFYTKLGFDT